MNSKSKWRNTEQGSAIITVIVFITIALIFISTLMVYRKFQYKSVTNYGYEIQTYYNAKSVLPLAFERFQNQLKRKNYKPVSYNFTLFQKDSTIAVIEPWGYFLYCSTSSKIKKIQSKRYFLIGNEGSEYYNYALVMGNIHNPVVVTGNTSITGDVAVGMQGVKPGVLRGVRYKGKETVYGNIIKRPHSLLPEINTDILNSQIKELKSKYNKSTSILELESKSQLLLKNGIYQLDQSDFDQLIDMGVKEIIGPGTIIIKSDISFENINLFNLITVYSEKKLEILGSVSCEHILVFAKDIHIDGPCKLKGQFFASEDFSIDRGANLAYPSVVGLISSKHWNTEPTFNIGENVVINGSVLLENDPPVNLPFRKHKLQIQGSAIINGIVYSDNYTELNGTINGTLLTNTFHFYYSPTIYTNWIRDAIINRYPLNAKFLYPLAFKNEMELTILQEI